MYKNAKVLIIGGGIIGSSIAYFLARYSNGSSVIVVDPGYAFASTPRSASAIRTQFHTGINVKMSCHGYDFYSRATEHLSVNGECVSIGFESCPYLILSGPSGKTRMEKAHQTQIDSGASVRYLLPDELEKRFNWLKIDGIGCATLGTGQEGWIEPRQALFALRRKAESLGVTYLPYRVQAIGTEGARVGFVHLGNGETIRAQTVVNAAGAKASEISRLAGIEIPIQSRKRTAFVFRSNNAPKGFLNFVDPTFASRGVYARPYRDDFLAVTSPSVEEDLDTDDLDADVRLFHNVIRPALARRVRGFESIELLDAWAGHYEMNTFDQNGIVGSHPFLANFVYACGFSGHGVMHAPSIGRGVAELLTTGCYQTLDLSPLCFERIFKNTPLDDVQASEYRKHPSGV